MTSTSRSRTIDQSDLDQDMEALLTEIYRLSQQQDGNQPDANDSTPGTPPCSELMDAFELDIRDCSTSELR